MSTILGLLAGAGDAESAVNNLTEEGVREHAISLILAREADARAVIADGGPLRATTVDGLDTRLSALGVSDSAAYAEAVRSGAALLAVSVSAELAGAVQQTFADYRAQRVQEV